MVEEARVLLDALRLDEAEKALQGAGDDDQELREEAKGLAAKFEAPGVRAAPGPWALAEGPRGRGLYTSRAFRAGEVVLTEAPCIIAPKPLVAAGAAEAPGAFDERLARRVWDSLGTEQRRLLAAFQDCMEDLPQALQDMLEKDESMRGPLRLARALKLNAHEYYAEPGNAALYLLVARANHSCNPCCGLAAADGGKLFFYALRDLKEGEEVDYSYLGGHFTLQPLEVRRKQLRSSKLFDCACARCEGPPEDLRCAPCEPAELARYERLEPMLGNKVEALESKWHDTSKDVGKYISDWEALAKSAGSILGQKHHVAARANFFALQALNTGLTLKLGRVDANRHANGLRSYGLPLARFLRESCPHGARCVSLEPVAAALLLQAKGDRALLAEVVAAAGRDALGLPLFDGARNKALAKLLRALDDEA